MCLQNECLEQHHLELFIQPPPDLRLLSPWLQHRKCCRWVALGQMDPRLTEREIVCLRQMSSGCQVSLAQQQKHLCCSNLRHTVDEALLSRGLSCLGEQ